VKASEIYARICAKEQTASVINLIKWQQILSRPMEEICELLCSESNEAQRLRQNPPFAGILPPTKVWEAKARFRQAPAGQRMLTL
jgi:hypothetical protein